jgi:hypothetical protein
MTLSVNSICRVIGIYKTLYLDLNPYLKLMSLSVQLILLLTAYLIYITTKKVKPLISANMRDNLNPPI